MSGPVTDIQVQIEASIGGFDAKMKSASASASVFERELVKVDLAGRKLGDMDKQAAKVEAAQRKMASAEAAAYREQTTRNASQEAGVRHMAAVEATAYREQEAMAAKRAEAQGKLANGMIGFGVAVGAGVGYAVSKFASFDKAMSLAGAATQATGGSLKALRAQALQTGADTQYTANEAAAGITAMGKAGVATQDILGPGLKGTLALAASGELAVGDAAEIAAVSMTQFGLSGKDIPHIADLLAAGAGKAQGDVKDLAEALKYVGPVAHNVNIPIEQTIGFLAELASNGVIASQAGTSMRGMLLRLEAPVGKSAKTLKELGISTYDSSGKFVGLSNIAGQLQTKLGGLSEAQRNAALKTIFGNEQITAATILYKGGAQAVDEWTNKVNDAGFAQRQAGELMNNLAGDFKILKGSLDTVLVQSGSGANSGLRDLTQGATTAVNAFSALPAEVQQSTVVVAGLTAGAALLAGGMIKGTLAVKTMRTNLAELGVTAETTGRVVGIAGKAAAALTVLSFAPDAFRASDQAIGAVGSDLSKMQLELANFAMGAGLAGDSAKVFGADLKGGLTAGLLESSQSLKNAVGDLSGANGWWNKPLPFLGTQEGEQIDQYSKALAGLAQKDAPAAAQAFQQLAQSGGLNADETQRLLGLMPEYSGYLSDVAAQQVATGQATAGTADASSVLAEQTGQAATGLQQVATAAAEAEQKVSDLQKAFKKVFEQRFGVEAAKDAVIKDLQQISSAAAGKPGKVTAAERTAATEAGKQAEAASLAAGDSKFVATAKGKKAKEDALKGAGGGKTGATALEVRDYLRGLVQDEQNVIGEMAAKGASPEQQKAAALILATEIDKAAKSLGIVGDAAKHYSDALRKDVPTQISTTFSADGIDPTLQKIAVLRAGMALINGQQVKFQIGAEILPTAANIREDRYAIPPTAKPAAQAAAKPTERKTVIAGFPFAHGGVVDSYASGEAHTAQIATGARMWAEPETGGEAYIPLAAGKRARSSAILQEVAHRFGMTVARPAAQVHVVRVPVQESHSTTYPVTNHIGQVVTADQGSFTDWSRTTATFGAGVAG